MLVAGCVHQLSTMSANHILYLEKFSSWMQEASWTIQIFCKKRRVPFTCFASDVVSHSIILQQALCATSLFRKKLSLPYLVILKKNNFKEKVDAAII